MMRLAILFFATLALLAFPGCDLVKSGDPVPPGEVLYVERDGSGSLYASRFDGSRATAVTDGSFDVDIARWSPNGRRIAFTSYTFGAGHPVLVIMNADGSDPQPVRVPPHDQTLRLNSFRWSPDGTAIAFSRVNLSIIDLATREVRQMTEVGIAVGEPSWSPNGRKIAVTILDTDGDEVVTSSLAIVDVDSRDLKRVRTYDYDRESFDFGPRYPAWSPDGSRIAYTRGPLNHDPRTYIYSVATDEVGEIEDIRGWSRPMWSPEGRSLVLHRERMVWPEQGEHGGLALFRALYSLDTGHLTEYGPLDGVPKVWIPDWHPTR